MAPKKRPTDTLLSVASIIGLVLSLSAMANAQPSITNVSPATQHRSGFVEIVGTGFGTGGQVLIDNLEVITTTWTDTRIAAYVPDGTLHFPDKALDPDGTLFWQFPECLSGGPSVGPDGVHYATTPMVTPRLYAISPIGTEKWHVVLDENPGGAEVDPTGSMVIVGSSNTLNFPGVISAHDVTNGARLWRQELPAEEPQIDNSWTGACGFNQYLDSGSIFTPGGETFYVMTAIATGGLAAPRGFLYAMDMDPSIPAPSTQLRSAAVEITAKARRGVRTIKGTVDVVDENLATIRDATIYATWTLPDGSTVDQVSAPSSGGGNGKKRGGKGGGGGAQFSIPDAGPGIYTLTVTNITKDGYAFDACHGERSRSVYL